MWSEPQKPQTYNTCLSYLMRASHLRIVDCTKITAWSRRFSEARSSRAAFVLSKKVFFCELPAPNIATHTHTQTQQFWFSLSPMFRIGCIMQKQPVSIVQTRMIRFYYTGPRRVLFRKPSSHAIHLCLLNCM